ncbi:MAG: S41 family peptidase, partial [Lachnospiraceae bacterium]|nr:S41 family peptidase [Lachnospiraceae bacterium]
ERGVIMGVTTYGKGVVQNLFTLSDGTILKFTTEEYFTPKGRNIHKKGIEPDIEVEYDEESESDNQLEEAVRHVRKMIEEQ